MREATPLSDAFVASLREERARETNGALEARDELEARLTSVLAAAREAWPDVLLEDRTILAYLAERVPEDEDPVSAVGSMKVSELYLACACAGGDPRAIASFEARFLSEVPSFVAQIDRNPAFVDEVRQGLREKLLVRTPDAPPKIVEFTGRGPLGGWLRVSAVRTALNLRRGKKNQDSAEDDESPSLSSPTPDPEIDYLKTRYGRELREALQTTLASLATDERNVLRMHYIDGLNIDEIGKTYRVHRATVARWLAAAREKILEETKRALSAKLQIDRQEVESMIGLVRSQLDVSIYRFLNKPGSGGA